MSGFTTYGAAPDGARSQTESVWHYLHPKHSSADASWEGMSAYTRPNYDAADASFVLASSSIYLGSTLINSIYLGSTPISAAYLGSTQVFG